MSVWNSFNSAHSNTINQNDFIQRAKVDESFESNPSRNWINNKDENNLSSRNHSIKNFHIRQTNDGAANLPYENESIRKDEPKTVCSGYRDFSGCTSKTSNEKLKCESPFSDVPQSKLIFPQKLYLMLSNPALEEIIAWLPHGRAFTILKPAVFKHSVIRLYFQGGKYDSFRRQMNAWGFRRISYHTYYHEMFLRGIPDLCTKMRRMTLKEKQMRKKNGNEPPPNFHRYCTENPMENVLNSGAASETASNSTISQDKINLGKSCTNKIEFRSSLSRPIPVLEKNDNTSAHDELLTKEEKEIRSQQLYLESVIKKYLPKDSELPLCLH